MAGRGEVASDPSGGPALGESRSRVLEVLKAVRGPLTVTEVAARVGLHPNTARFHLDGLVGQGLVERTREERDVPGRPRGLYAPSAGHRHAGRRSYRLLAQILASYLATHTTQPENGARAAGEEWGRFLADRPTPFHSVDGAAATQGLTDTLEEIGFAPEAVTADRRRKILLHHCPFREAAEQDGSVVCSVHLGLMQGVLGALEAPLEVTRLDPFVEPQLCVAHLAVRAQGTGTSRLVNALARTDVPDGGPASPAHTNPHVHV